MKSSPFSPWFKKARLGGKQCAVLHFWSPIEDPFLDNVLVVGDAAWTIEAEITGSIMCGWKAAHAVTLALRDNKPTREGVESYLAWWKESFLKYVGHFIGEGRRRGNTGNLTGDRFYRAVKYSLLV
jgi:hypothetical protein